MADNSSGGKFMEERRSYLETSPHSHPKYGTPLKEPYKLPQKTVAGWFRGVTTIHYPDGTKKSFPDPNGDLMNPQE